ncbi:hypothetical protein LguiA_011422 [Lonicera macranthoides]
MAMPTVSQIASVCGIIGNIVSFMVFLAPLPTFYKIYKIKSTKGFQSTPYSVALFSAMLLLYYGALKPNGIMLITINSIGCAIETTYLLVFMIYATKEAKVFTTKLILLFNIVGMGLLVIITIIFLKGEKRIAVVGWFTAIFSVCVFAAPLGIMRLVIKTKSVEFLPLPLSCFLTLNAIAWFFYGFLIKDYFIATPNILGFAFGIAQIILYAMYKGSKNKEVKQVIPDGVILDMTTLDNSKTNPRDTAAVLNEESQV